MMVNTSHQLHPCFFNILSGGLNTSIETYKLAGKWWHMPLILALGRISEFGASLVYTVCSRTARATQRNPVSNPPPPKKKNNKDVPHQIPGNIVIMAVSSSLVFRTIINTPFSFIR
jgi:hypothetical protein